MTKKKSDEAKIKKVFESKYDPKKLREMINAGKTADQIQKAIGIASKQSLRQHVMRLVNDDRMFYEVEGLYTRSGNTVRVGKHGLKLSPKKLDTLGEFPEGTEFTVEADGGQIILEMISADGAEDPVEETPVADPEGEGDNLAG
ncbi:hypothetical protein [Maridesulfovibrio sp.]|uniref:hypothetical protein n=1 Tax=unclassified Maridesulfovibrio TaxID=2794999 RepID=UPI003AFF9189